MKNVTAGLLILLISGLATAKEPQGYFGMGYGHTEYEEAGIADTVNPGVTFIKIGGNTNDYFGVELRMGLGVKDDTLTVQGLSVVTEFNYYYGLYLKAGAPIGSLYPYALVGYSKGELEVSAGGFSIEASDSDTSFGLGMSINLYDRDWETG